MKTSAEYIAIISDMLEGIYPPEERVRWWSHAHPKLGQKPPAEMVLDGQGDEVVSVLQRIIDVQAA